MTDEQLNDEQMCKCGKNPKDPPHVCPYAQEIHGNETECECCPDCTQECAWDI